MFKKFASILFVILALTFTSCTKDNKKPENSTEEQSSVVSHDPNQALDEIYKNVEIKGVETGDATFVQDIIGLNPKDFSECYIRKTDGKYGVADIYIVVPTADNMEKVLKAYTAFRDSRALDLKNYNIYNSWEITQDARIFSRGKYAVMIMIKDADEAEEILMKYLPAK